MKRLPVKEFLSLSKDHLVIDVRSPAEYDHAHLPGAVSLPLFSNEERKVVGTAYKQESREKAIKIGLDYFGPKMRNMVECVEKLLADKPHEPVREGMHSPPANLIFIYCWRGGMRSGAVAWLLSLYGFEVHVLAGGYKGFRKMALDILEQEHPLKVLGGLTGSGKTELLQELKKKGEYVIDLEKIANHKGSAFGKIDEGRQPSQEMFENLLATELLHLSCRDGNYNTEHCLPKKDPIWVEDESQRIGRINIPNTFWKTMRTSPLFFINIPFEKRLDYLVEQYGQKDKESLIECTQRIHKRLGGLNAKNTISFFNEGNIREAFRILLRYYDKTYLKGLHNRENLATLLHEIQCTAVSSKNIELLPSQYHTA